MPDNPTPHLNSSVFESKNIRIKNITEAIKNSESKQIKVNCHNFKLIQPEAALIQNLN